MLLKACLNGPRDVTEHPALPVRVASLAADALACVRAGAEAIHLHPRDADGLESLAAAVVDHVVPRARQPRARRRRGGADRRSIRAATMT